MASDIEMDTFVKDIIIDARLDARSQDITLNVFNALRDIPALRERYIAMGGGNGSYINAQIGAAIKRVLHKENLRTPVDVKHEFIKSYQRFKPEA